MNEIPKCPHCKRQLDHLDQVHSSVTYTESYVVDDGVLAYKDWEATDNDDNVTTWCCSLCGRPLPEELQNWIDSLSE
jgi:glutaredoxin